MPDERKPNRLRAIFKNAVVWGAGWGVIGTAVAGVMRLTDHIPPLHALLDGIGMGVRIGIVGGIVGAAFAAFISIAYRSKRLSEINWIRFGVGGLLFAGIFLPVFLEVMNLLSGGGLVPWHLIDGDTLMAMVFGGVTAAGTIRIAQLDEVKHPGTVQDVLERMEAQSIGAGGAADYSSGAKAHSSAKIQ
jgi:hypothetical protein